MPQAEIPVVIMVFGNGCPIQPLNLITVSFMEALMDLQITLGIIGPAAAMAILFG
jgi:hypothetical protein